MPLAPAARNLLDAMAAAGTPPLWELSIDEVRANREMLGGLEEPVPVAMVEDRAIPGPGGDLAVRIYTPEGDTPRPLIVYFHGGGFVFCSLDTHDNTCRRLANATGGVVFSVDYRLAPEHCFPAPLDDCYAATVWAHEHAAELEADPPPRSWRATAAGRRSASSSSSIP